MKLVVLDTSSLLRYFTNDIPSKAKKVKVLIESKNKIYIPDIVFPELEYVLLGKTYNANRNRVYKAFLFLATRKNIKINNEVKKAISIYKLTSFDIADCIILSYSTRGTLLSFDKKLSKYRIKE